MKKPRNTAQNAAPDAAEKDARGFAVDVLRDVVQRRLALDERLERVSQDPVFRALSPSDRGLVRAITTSAVRGLGLIRKTLTERLREGMPPAAANLEPVLIAAIAQILFLDVPDYAAVDTAIEKLRLDRRSDRYVPLANAVLRGIARERQAILAAFDPLADNTPGWLAERWSRAYGEPVARAIAAAHLKEPPLDLTVKADPEGWAERLGATPLPGGTLRLATPGHVPDLAGFDEGAWWVQDAAAALPARILAPRPGERILDLCAAPGGKSAQLAAAGASVVAVDRSAPRLTRLTANFERLGLTAEIHAVDALAYSGEPFDAILLDAPCSATGTIRRHPDVAWSKTLADVATLASLQTRLLDHAWTLLRPGGRLVYATCSLEPEEGERQAEAFLARTPDAALTPIAAETVGGVTEWIDGLGRLRALPCHLDAVGGCDGFFAVRFDKKSSLK